jgi:hydroxymethylpyrimidine/phosphomethylpyrimidine kinase
MLATVELVEAVAEALTTHRLAPYVLDPVMVSTSGHRLLDPDAVDALAGRLLPLATLVTPNLEEARILTGLDGEGEEGARESARRLVEMGAAAALIKGGHAQGEVVLDLLWDGKKERIWRHPRIDTRQTHGTGCTLSAGIAAGLALGLSLQEAVDRALSFVAAAIREAPGLGSGHGPLNHFVLARPAMPPAGEG